MKFISQRRPTVPAVPPFKDDADICQQLMSRYSTSTAPQHRHLLATAAAIRSILTAESLPLTPPAYFAAAIDNLSNSKSLDSTAVAALLSLFSIVLPLIQEKSINEEKASEAVGVLVGMLEAREGLAVGTLSGAVKCLGVLLVRFCDLEVWDSVKLGFETLLKFSVDKRPKVRKSAQDCMEKLFRSFQSAAVINEAGKLVLSLLTCLWVLKSVLQGLLMPSGAVINEAGKLVLLLLRSYMPVAVKVCASRIIHTSESEISLNHEHLEVLHLLNLLRLVGGNLSDKVSLKVLLELCKLMCQNFSALTRHVLTVIEAIFEAGRDKIIGPQLENIINCLSLYISVGENNPTDTLVLATKLLKMAFDKLSAGGYCSSLRNVRGIVGSLAGLLTCESAAASQASEILKQVIKQYIDRDTFLSEDNQSFRRLNQESEEAESIRETCSILENNMSSCNGILNEHLLGVISVLLRKLGDVSFIFMKSVVVKLADLMNYAVQNVLETNHLRSCIGSAIVAMGPEKILMLIPISINGEDFTCSNTWLIPILNDYIVGASLGYYMDHIVPLAKSFQRASRKVKNSVTGEDLQAHAHDLWSLLPAFCRYPVDGHEKFRSLAKLLIKLLNKDSSMHQHIAFALQVLVNQNRDILVSEENSCDSDIIALKDSCLELRVCPIYSKKMAKKNIKAMASGSIELLQALADLFVHSLPEKRLKMKDAIEYLVSIVDPSITKNIFMLLLRRFNFANDGGEFEDKNSCDILSDQEGNPAEEKGNPSAREKDIQRCVMLELASAFIHGAQEDLVVLIYSFISFSFSGTNKVGHCEAYKTLSRILEEHAWFCSSRNVELIDLLLGLKPSADPLSVKYRFTCLQILMVQALEMNLEEENTKTFVMLNEIIVALKDAKDEARKVAYDTLLAISSSLRSSFCTNSGESYYKLINMIMGYLSGSSPHIKSGAVSALSVVVYNDADTCCRMPNLVPSLMSLLQDKAVEVIKAVLGFAKVLVSCLQAKDLQTFIPDIINGVLPWSSVSRHHFREKVTVILEIIIRKYGFPELEIVTPEKYRSFVKTVFQNRRHKPASKDMEPSPEDSSDKRAEKQKQKQKRKKSSYVPDKSGSLHHIKRDGTGREADVPSNSKESRGSIGDGDGPKGVKRARNLEKDRSQWKVGNKSNKGTRVQKRKLEHEGTSGQGKVAFKRRDSALKLQRPRKDGKTKTSG
ncbi:hypothetical protein K2173_022124 [Erythroxylum novogranatense]|uniref:RRP12-like protein n=1 Tax=Erythroxylum novogranatense TaxID=1862640 RepID=A0AAV8STF7_9ROSI|nr:hypothetical protein K2173_022124 [Erythroxylum novogranatense]